MCQSFTLKTLMSYTILHRHSSYKETVFYTNFSCALNLQVRDIWSNEVLV